MSYHELNRYQHTFTSLQLSPTDATFSPGSS